VTLVDMLRPYQAEAAERIASAGAMLLADQPGLGKTFTSLGSLYLADRLRPGTATLIAAPLITCDTAWLPTIQSYMPEVCVVDAFSGSRAARSKRVEENRCDDKHMIIVTNHDSLGISKSLDEFVPAIHAMAYSALFIDESHMVLPMDYDSPADATQFWRGLFKLSDDCPDALRLAISGTPDRGKLHYRFGTWRFLYPQFFGRAVQSYQDWLRANFYTYDITVPVSRRDGSRFDATVQKIGHMLNAPRWHFYDAQSVVRRTKSEVATELPAKRYLDIDVPHPQALAKAYMEYRDEFMTNDDGSKGNALVYSLRAQQFASCEYHVVDRDGQDVTVPKPGGVSAKRDWLIEWLSARNLGVNPSEPPTGQVVVSSQFSQVLYWLKAELADAGFECEVIDGSLPQHRRSALQRSFQAGDFRIALLSSGLGVGLDLDAADDLIFFDVPRSPDVQEQVEDRIHRISRVHQVTIWRLRSRGTIDVLISATNDATFHSTRALLDGVRAVEFDRNIVHRLEER